MSITEVLALLTRECQFSILEIVLALTYEEC